MNDTEVRLAVALAVIEKADFVHDVEVENIDEISKYVISGNLETEKIASNSVGC